MSSGDSLPRLASRPADSHKGTYGHALLVGGSRGMTGAIALSGKGALASGAGLVTLAVPDRCLETLAGLDPCYMTVPLPDDAHGRLAAAAESPLLEWASRATAVGCGPGLGQSEAVTTLVHRLHTQVSSPMVLDADALNALACHSAGLRDAAGPRIVTPHPGEFDRLSGERADSRERREALAVEMAARYDMVVVLKGHHTLISDGKRTFHNRETGNPGMATGGSGDVLTGVIVALLCQQMGCLDAARLGVHVHGLAGDVAARNGSQVAMTALSIVGGLAEAWRHLA